MATHSSILTWKIPWTEEPDRLQSKGSQRVRQDWATNTHPEKQPESSRSDNVYLAPRQRPKHPSSSAFLRWDYTLHNGVFFLYSHLSLYCPHMLINTFPSLILGQGFPGGTNGKESACNAGDLGLIPGSRRSSGEGNGNPLQYSHLENRRDGGAWWAPSMELHRVGHDWSDLAVAAAAA